MLHYKKYNSYEDYLEDQVAKLRIREDYVREKSRMKFYEFCNDFVRLKNHIKEGCKILCLGARFGDEVRAFRKLGYNAIGIDLWADIDDLVIKGDWNDLPFENEFDAVYTNSIDHASDLENMIKQILKALKNNGKVVLDLFEHHSAASNRVIEKRFKSPERYEAMLWNNDNDILSVFEKAGFSQQAKWIDREWHTYLLERKNGQNI